MGLIETLFGVLSNEQIDDIVARLEAVANLNPDNKHYHQLLKLFLLEQRRRQIEIKNKEIEQKNKKK